MVFLDCLAIVRNRFVSLRASALNHAKGYPKGVSVRTKHAPGARIVTHANDAARIVFRQKALNSELIQAPPGRRKPQEMPNTESNSCQFWPCWEGQETVHP